MEHGSMRSRADTSSWSTVEKCPTPPRQGSVGPHDGCLFAASAHVEQEVLAWAESLHVPFLRRPDPPQRPSHCLAFKHLSRCIVDAAHCVFLQLWCL